MTTILHIKSSSNLSSSVIEGVAMGADKVAAALESAKLHSNNITHKAA